MSVIFRNDRDVDTRNRLYNGTKVRLHSCYSSLTKGTVCHGIDQTLYVKWYEGASALLLFVYEGGQLDTVSI